MRNARTPVVALLALIAPFVACAVGDQSPDVGGGPVTAQSQTGEGGPSLDDAAPSSTTIPTPTPAPGVDAAAPPASGDAAPPVSDDATAPVDSALPPPPPVDSGSTSSCPGYAPPATSAHCTCDPAQHACTANGCYNGYYCKLSDTTCHAKPSSC